MFDSVMLVLQFKRLWNHTKLKLMGKCSKVFYMFQYENIPAANLACPSFLHTKILKFSHISYERSLMLPT